MVLSARLLPHGSLWLLDLQPAHLYPCPWEGSEEGFFKYMLPKLPRHLGRPHLGLRLGAESHW